MTLAQGGPGSHGYIKTDPMMNAIFIAWCAGIRKGVHIETSRNVDLAPTIASLLGLKMDAVDGIVLKQVLH